MSGMPGSDDRRYAGSRVKLTYDDLMLLPKDDLRHELIDGVHYVTPSPNLRHQEISGRLHLAIGNWLEDHPLGRIYYAPVDVIFTMYDCVVPDLLYVSNERAKALTKKHVRGAPDLVIEIKSPGTSSRDSTLKLRLYERQNVAEYWIIDPKRDLVQVCRRKGDRFGRAEEFSRQESDVLTTPLLPGLVIPLSRILAE